MKPLTHMRNHPLGCIMHMAAAATCKLQGHRPPSPVATFRVTDLAGLAAITLMRGCGFLLLLPLLRCCFLYIIPVYHCCSLHTTLIPRYCLLLLLLLPHLLLLLAQSCRTCHTHVIT